MKLAALKPKKLISWLKEKHRVPPLRQTVDQISVWYDTPLGRSLLNQQEKILNDELSCLFGYHLMQLSVVPHEKLFGSSRISHCFSISPSEFTQHNDGVESSAQGDASVYAEFDALPIANEAVDVTILHHALEFSENPHQLLKEAARATIARGYIIIFAFNPVSVMGVIQLAAQFLSRKAIWRRRNLRISRVRDWLEFLDFTCVSTRCVSHNLPINNEKYLTHSRFIDRFFNNKRFPFGSSYCIVARKDKVGLTPIKPAWETKTLLGSVPVSKRAMRSGPSGMVIPLRPQISSTKDNNK